MSAAYFDVDGNVVQLDGKASPDEVATAADVADPEKLARMVTALRRDVAELKRRWNPRKTYFRDQVVTASTTTKIRLEHGFGGRVNFWPCDWKPTVAGTEARIERHGDSDDNTLVVVSNAAGTVTVLVEAAG